MSAAAARLRPITYGLAVGIFGTGLMACSTEKRADEAAERVAAALVKGDRADFERAVVSRVSGQYPPKRFQQYVAIVRNLGAYQSKKRVSFTQACGKRIAEARFWLQFERGRVGIRLTVGRDGRITSLGIGGEAIEAGFARLREQKLHRFRVQSLELFAAGPPRTRFSARQTIRFRVAVHGLKERDSDLRFRVDLEVRSAAGAVVAKHPGLLRHQQPVTEGDAPVARARGSVPRLAPGTYRLRFTVTDPRSGKSATVDRPVTIRASVTSP